MGTTWKDKLPNALWAYWTAYVTPIGMSPYQLVYEKTCHLPVELEFKAHWAIRRWKEMLLEIIEECNYQNWKNGERKHITIQRSTKKESKGGMTRGSRRRVRTRR